MRKSQKAWLTSIKSISRLRANGIWAFKYDPEELPIKTIAGIYSSVCEEINEKGFSIIDPSWLDE